MTAPAGDTASEHARVKALFNAVCDIEDPAEQLAQLQVCEADEGVRRRVWAMLEADRAEATAFSAPVAALKAAALEADAPELKPGDRLGAWTLVGCTVAPGFEFSGFEMAPPGFSPG